MAKKEKCPNGKSTKIYQEISICAKQMVNTGRIFDINKANIDNAFEPYYCQNCGWSDDPRFSQV